jgi:hypothetical protein
VSLELTYRIGNPIIAAIAKEFLQEKVSALSGHPEVGELIEIVADYRAGVIPASVAGDWIKDHDLQPDGEGEWWVYLHAEEPIPDRESLEELSF